MPAEISPAVSQKQPSRKRDSLGAALDQAAKKAKKSSLQGKCGVIEGAIKRAAEELPSLTSTAAAALVATLPFSLGQAKDERHHFQEETVSMVGQILELYKDTLQAKVEEGQSDIVKAEGRRDEALALAQQMQVNSDDAHKKALQLKNTLAEVARSFQAAKALMAEAERIALEGQKELKMAGIRKEEVEKLQHEMNTVHEEGESSGRRLKDFASRVQKYVAEDTSLLTAIPCAFSKEPSSRGEFDTMVAEQLAQELKKAIANLEGMINNGDAAVAERENAVKSSSEALQEDRRKQIEAARAYMEAVDEARAAAEALQKAKSQITQARKTLKVATEAETEARVDLEVYCQDVLESFAELRDRVTVNEKALVEAASPPAVYGMESCIQQHVATA